MQEITFYITYGVLEYAESESANKILIKHCLDYVLWGLSSMLSAKFLPESQHLKCWPSITQWPVSEKCAEFSNLKKLPAIF